MLDDIWETIRELALAGFMVLLIGVGIGTAASYGLMFLPAQREAEVLRVEVAELEVKVERLRTELERCQADVAEGMADLEACMAKGDPVEEYYRGSYDVCLTVLGLSFANNCREAGRKAYEKDRHEESSYRWRWPIPTPTPTPDPDREARRW